MAEAPSDIDFARVWVGFSIVGWPLFCEGFEGDKDFLARADGDCEKAQGDF